MAGRHPHLDAFWDRFDALVPTLERLLAPMPAAPEARAHELQAAIDELNALLHRHDPRVEITLGRVGAAPHLRVLAAPGAEDVARTVVQAARARPPWRVDIGAAALPLQVEVSDGRSTLTLRGGHVQWLHLPPAQILFFVEGMVARDQPDAHLFHRAVAELARAVLGRPLDAIGVTTWAAMPHTDLAQLPREPLLALGRLADR